MKVSKRKLNTLKFTDKTYKFIGIGVLALVLFGQIYSSLFPDNLEELARKSNANWEKALKEVEELRANNGKIDQDNSKKQIIESDKNNQINNFTYWFMLIRVLAFITGFLFIYLALFL